MKCIPPAWSLALPLSFGLVLAGCSASVQQQAAPQAPQLPQTSQAPQLQQAPRTPSATGVAPSAAKSVSIAKLVLVVAPANDAVAQRPDWPDLVAALTAAMAKAAADARIEFSSYGAGAKPAPEAGTWVTLKVADYKLIGSDKRFSMSAVAGSGQLDAEATFADLQTGRETAKRKYSASSGAFQGLFSAPSERQLDVLSAQVLKDVLKP